MVGGPSLLMMNEAFFGLLFSADVAVGGRA
jgi:hypothetical protein